MYNNETIELFKKTALSRGLTEEFVSQLLGSLSTVKPYSAKMINMSIAVKGLEYPLEFSNSKAGKLFELRGINKRYKTTTLILIGLLLGCDWTSQTKYTNNYQLESQIEQILNYLFLSGTQVTLQMILDNREIAYLKVNNKITVTIDGNEIINDDLNDFEDYSKYQKEASKLFKVQFISKGRDFVTQVHNEILSEVKNSIDYIVERGRNVISQATPKGSRVFPKSLREYQNTMAFLKALEKEVNGFQEFFPNITNLDVVLSLKELSKCEERLSELQEKMKYASIALETLDSEYQLLNKQLMPNNFILGTLDMTWTNPVPSFENIIESIDQVNGNELVPIKIDIQGSYPKSFIIRNKLEMKNAFVYLNEEQSQALEYQRHKESYIRLHVLKKEIEHTQLGLTKLKEEYNKLAEYTVKLRELSERQDIKTISNKVGSINKLLEKVEISDLFLPMIKERVVNKINEVNIIIAELQKPVAEKAYQPYEILNPLIKDLLAVKSLLEEMGNDQETTNQSIRITAEKSSMYREVVGLFNEMMKERCKYYYDVQGDDASCVPLKDYDFSTRYLTTQDGTKISARYGLSGGTDSAMTVTSLASCPSDTMFGTVVLVDEWGDVSDKLASVVYEKLVELDQLCLCICVRVNNDQTAKIYEVGELA